MKYALSRIGIYSPGCTSRDSFNNFVMRYNLLSPYTMSTIIIIIIIPMNSRPLVALPLYCVHARKATLIQKPCPQLSVCCVTSYSVHFYVLITFLLILLLAFLLPVSKSENNVVLQLGDAIAVNEGWQERLDALKDDLAVRPSPCCILIQDYVVYVVC